MPDLKAAAKWLRKSIANSKSDINRWPCTEIHVYKTALRQSIDEQTLAAHALEAWAWQEEKGAVTKRWGKSWRCCYYDGAGELVRFDADTPLGAVLAAMEGETDGN